MSERNLFSVLPPLLLFIIAIVPMHCQSMENHNPTVNLNQGAASGKTMKSINGKEFNAFLGIPYGKVVQRFAAPEPAEPWTGTLNATKDGVPCKQFDALLKRAIFGEEDCLTLNVYTPNLPSTDDSTKPLPVIVYIYGGGFAFGEATSTEFGPERYMSAKNPFVLALMNYRVGPLGFLSTNDDASSGNYGLLDQVMALRWIQENIGAFNGDKNKVTISGESAGGASVIYHLLSPLSAGLFHGAIAQSGSALCPWALSGDPLLVSQTIAEHVQCPTENTTEMVECLRQVDADIIVKAASNVSAGINLSTVPVIENSLSGKFLTESPLKLMQEGRFHKVPLISGITADETSILVLLLANNSLLPPVQSAQDKNWNDVIKLLLLGTKSFNSATVEAIKEIYFKDVNYDDINDVRFHQVKYSSDLNFDSCNDKTVRLLSAGGIPVYMYVFNYANEDLSPTKFSGKPDVGHTTELQFLFNYTQFGQLNFTDEANMVSDQVLDLWTNFATHGTPTPSGPLQWYPTPPGEIQYLNISLNMGMESGYETEQMQFWNDKLYAN